LQPDGELEALRPRPDAPRSRGGAELSWPVPQIIVRLVLLDAEVATLAHVDQRKAIPSST